MKEVIETRWERIEDEREILAEEALLKEQDKINNIFYQLRYDIESNMDGIQKGDLTLSQAKNNMLETLYLLYYGWDEDEE